MTANEASRPAGGMPSQAGSTSPWSSCPTCGRPDGKLAACVCGHLPTSHALASDRRTRKACSVSTGPKATPCGCRRYQPATPEEDTPA